MKNCKHCGKEFVPHRASGKQRRLGQEPSYCSRRCAYDARPIGAGRLAKLLRVDYECKNCGSSIIGTSRRERFFCSPSCLGEFRRKPKPCNKCGVMLPFKEGTCRMYCEPCSQQSLKHSQLKSRKTNRKTHKSHKRRARLRGLQFDRFNADTVFDRDGWQCKACLRSTPKELKGTNHPDAPVLDHVIPMARGGHHTMPNTQCLCRTCNNIKRDSLIDNMQVARLRQTKMGDGFDLLGWSAA